MSADQNSRRTASAGFSCSLTSSVSFTSFISFVLNHFRTLFRNGTPATPLQSIACALFPMQRRGCPFITTHRPLHTPYKLFRINIYKVTSQLLILNHLREQLNPLDATLMQKRGEGVDPFHFVLPQPLVPIHLRRLPADARMMG